MTAVLVVGLAGCVAAAAAAFVAPAWRLAVAWWHVHHVCAHHHVTDSGGVHPLWLAGFTQGLPNAWRISGGVAQDTDVLAKAAAEVEHYLGQPHTLTRRPRSRVLELRQAPPLPAVPPAPPTPVSPWLLPVGHGRDGPCWWDVRTAYHCLAVGRTGFGKSSFALWLTAQVGRSHYWHVEVVDPELDDLHLQLDTLRYIDAELERRDPEIGPRTRWLVVIDEFDAVMEVTTRQADPDDYETRREIRRLIRKLLQRGGKRGLHVLALAQDPRAEAVGRGIRSKFGARLAGWLDASEYSLVLDCPVPHSRRGPRGRGWWLAEGGIPVEIQAHSMARQRRESEGPSETTAHRIMPALSARKWR